MLASALRSLCRAALLATAVLLLVVSAAAADDAPPLPDAPALPDAAPAEALPAPVITLTAPLPGGAFGAGSGIPLAADAAGAITVVSFHVDGKLKCVDARPPYGCTWSPAIADLGKHVVEARVTDVTGRTASAFAEISVGRLIPPSIGATTVRRKLSGNSWRLTTTGSVAVPSGLTQGACAGTASVTVLAGTRTVVDRSVPVTPACTFSSRVRFRTPAGASAVRVKVAYDGAQLLAPRSAPTQTLRLR